MKHMMTNGYAGSVHVIPKSIMCIYADPSLRVEQVGRQGPCNALMRGLMLRFRVITNAQLGIGCAVGHVG